MKPVKNFPKCIPSRKRNLSFFHISSFLLGMIMTVFFLLPFSVSAQNFSGLQDKELAKLDDIGAAVSSLFSKVEGNVDKVEVTYDSENLLKIRVYYTGFETAYLRAKTLNTEKANQNEITETELNLDGKTSPVELSFPLKSGVAEGTRLESPFLEVKITKSKSQYLGKTFLFALNKKWQTEINPENIVISIVLEPIGSAVNLKEGEQKIILPAKSPVFKAYYMDKSKTVSGTQNTRINPNLRPYSTTKTPAKKTTTKSSSVDGTWINEDTNTRGLTKVIVSGGGKKIQVFGKCSPKDCDWGVKTLFSQGTNKYRALYDQNHAASNIYLTLTGNTLVVKNARKYKSNNQTKTTTDKFKKQTFQMVTVRPLVMNTAVIKDLSLNKEEVDKGAQGPDNNPISLWEDLVTDANFEFPHEITNIRLDIYPDKNPASGIFYYLPAAYHLRWNTNEGYLFKMLYGTGTDEGEAGDVRMAATLTPGVSTKEVDMIKKLLSSYVKRNPGTVFSKLRLIPLQETPTISFLAELQGQYEIAADKVSVNVTSSITNPVDVSWVTDNRTKEEMQVALVENVGIQGIMTLKPQSESVPEQQIPVRITLADPQTLGRFVMEPHQWRKEKWKNQTPYPLKLKYIHALIIKEEGNKSIPLIYSWKLGNKEIPPQAQVTFETGKMPAWIDNTNKAERIWLDYEVVPCEDCDKKVINELTGGTAGSTVKNITFEAFQVFETTGASFLQVKIRSVQGDPKGDKIVELPAIRIDQDMETFSTGPLHLQEGDQVEYEYFFTLLMPDGQPYRSDNWIKSNELEMFIGMHNLREAISTLPENLGE